MDNDNIYLKPMLKTVSIVLQILLLLSVNEVAVCHAKVELNENGGEDAARNEVARLLEWSYACRSYQTNKIDTDFTLQMDIDLTGIVWVPIGDWTIPYTGTFNGNGHKITGLYVEGKIEAGFFGGVGRGGVVKDLHIEGGIVSGSGTTGGICGVNKGGLIEGCSFSSGVVECKGRFAIGGICGSNTNIGNIIGCVVRDTEVGCLHRGSSSGGIVGVNDGLIAACLVSGGQVGNESSFIPVGGITYKNNGRIVSCMAMPQRMGKTAPFPGGITYENSGIVTYSLWKKGRGVALGITEDLNPYPQQKNCLKIDENSDRDEHFLAMNKFLKKGKISWRWTILSTKDKTLEPYRIK
ncbi:hypothetical protein [Parabacteroides sp. PF5-6]|uniref:hypothetical protein n=1 Tax=Parabacteroides sp. PF5-6 TaxID=1742403 RepID=UPI0024070EB6|nr:hypothetical protein [Parabacteroides sp. PF5-6]MDF9829169.1 hypothetical protein [Parabacteroides sp. PF5-6]